MKTAIHHLFVNVSEICRSISFPIWMIFVILYKSCGSCRLGVAQQSSMGQGQLSGQAGGRVLALVPAPWTSHVCCVGEYLFSWAREGPAAAESVGCLCPFLPQSRASHVWPLEKGRDGAEPSAVCCISFCCFACMCK